MLALAIALGTGVGACRTNSEDVRRWATTVQGPKKLIAVLTHDKYPIELRVASSSVGNFGPGATFSGNGGAQISCDDTSLIFGPGLAGLPNKAVACKNIEHETGPPRPSVPKEQEE
jgi:hypothetical protein